MDWRLIVFETIDMRSFSNLWYWIALTVMWSSLSHWVMGVPYDLVLRARRDGGQTMEDLETLTRVNCNRFLFMVRVSGPWILGLSFFTLTSLVILGFKYEVEFAQAVFLLAFPMLLVGLLSLRSALDLEAHPREGIALCNRLRLHRIMTQLIGVVSVFTTAMWGVYQNLNLGALG